MIPFPMVNNFSTAIPKYYDKVVYSRVSVGLLTHDKEFSFYATGDSARMGMNFPRYTFLREQDNIADAWSNSEWTFLRTTTGGYWWSGSSNVFGISTGVPWSNQTSRFVGFGTAKKMIVSNYTIYVLNTVGDVYACGSNSYGSWGNGTTTGSTTFKKLPISNVKDIYTAPDVVDNFYYTTVDNTLYGAGYGGRGGLGAALSSTGANSSFIKLAEQVQDVRISAYGYAIKKADGNWYGTGASKNGIFGTGTTDSAAPAYTDDNLFVLPGGVGVQRVFLGPSCTHIIGEDNKLYFGGATSSTSPISGSPWNDAFWSTNVLNFTEVPGWDTGWSNKLSGIFHYATTCTYFVLRDVVYGCGRTSGNSNYSLLPGYNANTSVFGFKTITVPGLM